MRLRGTLKSSAIEIQGDQREAVARILAEAGFRPVLPALA